MEVKERMEKVKQYSEEFKKRLKALEKKSAEEGLVFTEEQLYHFQKLIRHSFNA